MAKLDKDKKEHLKNLLHTALKKDKTSKGIFQVAYDELKDKGLSLEECKKLVKAREFALAGEEEKFEEVKAELEKKYL